MRIFFLALKIHVVCTVPTYQSVSTTKMSRRATQNESIKKKNEGGKKIRKKE